MTIAPTGLFAPEVASVVQYAYETGGFTTRSDYARGHIEAIAAAACQGFLTTEVPGVGFGPAWRITALGLDGLSIILSGKPSCLYSHGTLPRTLTSIDQREREPAVLN